MNASTAPDITELLQEVNAGKPGAAARLMAVVNDDLRARAGRQMRRRFGPGLAGVTLQPTALVNEAYLRIIEQRTKYDNSGHFYGIATRVLRGILLDYCEKRRAKKRGGGQRAVSYDPNLHDRADTETAMMSPDDQEALLVALEKLEQRHPAEAEIAHRRLIWGQTIEQTAQSLGIGHATVERRWRFAQAWLSEELCGERP